MMVHDLKCWPEPFRDLCEGLKTHEVRVFDRDYKVGDTLRLREYDPEKNWFSGRQIEVDVTCITMPGAFGLPDNICVMSVRSRS